MAIERSVVINILTNNAQRNLNQLNRSLNATDRAASTTSRATVALTGALTGLASAASARQVAQYADTYTQLQNQLRLVTDNSEDLVTASERLLAISNDTRNGLESTVSLYARLSRSTDELGVSSERLFAITESVGQALAISGGSAASAQAALFQLGQGLGAGALRGEELNSVLEQTPRLATAIADGLGVTIAQLRALGAEGELTSERVILALESQAEVLGREFGNTTSTIAQAFGRINNELTVYIGQVDEANGVTQSVTSTLVDFADNLESIAETTASVLVPSLLALAAVYGGRLAGGIAAATAARAASITVAFAETAAYRENATVVAASNATRAASQLAETETVLASTLAQRAAQAQDIASLATTEATLIAERVLETQRLAAQTTLAGRTASVTNLAGIEQVRLGITRQTVVAETALIASTATLTAAENANTIAATEATAANRALSVAIASTSRGAIAATASIGIFSRSLAFVGGPVGAIVIAAASLAIYVSSLGDSTRSTNELNTAVNVLGRNLNNISAAQAGVRLLDLSDELEELQRVDRAARAVVETFNVRAQRGFALDQEALTRATANQETATTNLNRAQTLQANLQRVVAGTYTEVVAGAEDSDRANNSLIDSYSGYLSQVNRAAAVNQRYDTLIREITRDVTDLAQRTDLIAQAELRRSEALATLNARSERQATTARNLVTTYQDLATGYSETFSATQTYNQAVIDINRSTATAEQRTVLLAQAQEQLVVETLSASDSYSALLSSLDPVARITSEYQSTLQRINTSTATQAQQTELTSLATAEYTENLRQANIQTQANATTNQSFFGALSQGFMDSASSSSDAYTQIREIGSSTFNSLQQGLTDFIVTGEADVRSFAATVIAQLATVAAQQAIVGSLTGSSIGGFLGFAQGGAFSGQGRAFASGGVPSLGAFSNSVVSSPTRFAAGGSPNNVMGEAGSEAILPLTRTSSGNLGVETVTSGGGGGGTVNNFNAVVQVNPTGNQAQDQQAANAQVEALRREFNGMISSVLRNQQRPGGQLNPTGL